MTFTQGFTRGQVIEDKTVTRQKLADDVILKLEEGGDNTILTSDNVEDGYSRDGYDSPGTTLKDNLDGISNAMVDVTNMVNTMIGSWDCASGIEPLQAFLEAESGDPVSTRMAPVGSPYRFEVDIQADGLITPIQWELPQGYKVVSKKNWNSFKGGTLVIETTFRNMGKNPGAMLIYGQSGGKHSKMLNKMVKFNHKAYLRK